jgi:hypothetical protein
MTPTDAPPLPSAPFAIAAAITMLFSTGLAWAKDAYQPLTRIMNTIAGHNWIAHGAADLVLFFGTGIVLSKSQWPSRMAPNRVITLLVAAAVISGVGLFGWYAAF